MDGIVEELLRLEGVKSEALINRNAPVYDESVREQLYLLDSSPNLAEQARLSSESLAKLAKLIRLNTALFLNLASSSAAFQLTQSAYTSTGRTDALVHSRFVVEA